PVIGNCPTGVYEFKHEGRHRVEIEIRNGSLGYRLFESLPLRSPRVPPMNSARFAQTANSPRGIPPVLHLPHLRNHNGRTVVDICGGEPQQPKSSVDK